MSNPLNRPNDSPENPLEDMSAPLVPMNEGAGLSKTIASKKDTFFQKGDPEINSPDAAGPKGALTQPGGNDMIMAGMSPVAEPTAAMQFAKEGSDSYAGKETRGKVVHPSANEKLNKIYG